MRTKGWPHDVQRSRRSALSVLREGALLLVLASACVSQKPLLHVVVDGNPGEASARADEGPLDCDGLCRGHLPPGTMLEDCHRVQIDFEISDQSFGVMCDYR